MALTEQQKRWNQSVEEAWKNRNKKKVIYNRNTNPNSTISELFEELKEKILELNPEGIELAEKSNYISFKIKRTNKSFVDIQLQKAVIKCVINLKKKSIKDKEKALRDISKIGHFGSGDYEITIKSYEDLPYSLVLIKKAYDINSK